MSRIAYVNGSYIPQPQATTHIEDRGYQFADGVYEVVALIGGKLLDFEPHIDRLDYSLNELKIKQPVSRPALRHIIHTVIQKNRLKDGMVYLQVTRGVATRNHEFPQQSRPVLVITCRYICQKKIETMRQHGIKVISLPDIRWARPDIKSISLLPNILGKQQAIEKGAYEAILINRDGFITETNSTNFWIILENGVLQTHPASQEILNGITRQRLIQIANSIGLKIKEQPFTLDDAYVAKEAFLSSSISGILPVTQINDYKLGTGQPGNIVSQLIQHYRQFSKDIS
jgi:D-alanine transaminase